MLLHLAIAKRTASEHGAAFGKQALGPDFFGSEESALKDSDRAG
jgi:hypothetical protein